MNISMIGTGYVGLTTGTCLSNLGHNVICVDIDQRKIDNLNNGIMPIYEPGLEELVKRGRAEERLSFMTDLAEAVRQSEVIFIAVGTPSTDSGQADLSFVFKAAEQIARNINSYKVIVDKSTVPVGTAEKVRCLIKSITDQEFDVVSNPEFLRQGAAVKDFMNPDRIVIGADSDKAAGIMKKVYQGLERYGNPVIVTNTKSAEMIKYAANSMLACRISFINQLANLCEKVGADIKEVAKGIGTDKRIGPKFLHAGIGYGGSCFPKDVKALIHSFNEHGIESDLFEAIDNVNQKQKSSLMLKIRTLIPDLGGKTIGVWGLAFKPKTDDLREAPSLVLIRELINHGAQIKAFDPVAASNARKIFGESIVFGKTPYDALDQAHGLVIVTEWDEFRTLSFEKIKQLLLEPNIIDGRNIYDPKEMRELGFNYIGVGRGSY